MDPRIQIPFKIEKKTAASRRETRLQPTNDLNLLWQLEKTKSNSTPHHKHSISQSATMLFVKSSFLLFFLCAMGEAMERHSRP